MGFAWKGEDLLMIVAVFAMLFVFISVVYAIGSRSSNEETNQEPASSSGQLGLPMGENMQKREEKPKSKAAGAAKRLIAT
jgi:hypothetical protein